MKINKLYESIEGGLSRLVDKLSEDVLLEKKQEISPEDQRDNELIRSAMKKRIKNPSAKFSKKEQDALDRNGWTVDSGRDLGRIFKTANGEIEMSKYRNAANSMRNYSKRPNFSIYNYAHSARPVDVVEKNYFRPDDVYPANVNLADMGRKQQERAKNRPSPNPNRWSNSVEVRGSKKNGKKSFTNRLNAERTFDNDRTLGIVRSKYKDAKRDISAARDDIEYANRQIKRRYDSEDSNREYYIKKIAEYKKLLAELDSVTERDIEPYNDRVNTGKQNIKNTLDTLRAEFENRKKKNESLLLEKRQPISPEDERDNELIRSALEKRQKRSNAKLSKEEKDALERNGYKVDGQSFYSANGYMSTSWSHQPNMNTYSASNEKRTPRVFKDRITKRVERENPDPSQPWYRWDYVTTEYEPNVNLADRGRKQQERAKNRIANKKISSYRPSEYEKYFSPEKGAKKAKLGHNADWNINNRGNFRNRLDAERYEQNKNLQKNYDDMKKKLSDRKQLEVDREDVFSDTDLTRASYLKEIQRYKKLLQELDDREQERLRFADERIKNKNDEIRAFLDSKKKGKNEE